MTIITHTSENTDQLSLALSKAQGMLKNASKDSKGFGYKYASLASCLNTLKNPLKEHELAVSQVLDSSPNDKLVVVTYLLHSSGQWIRSNMPIIIENTVRKQGNPMQDLGSSITYARRYALAAILNIAQEDDDAASAVTKETDENTFNSHAAELKDLCEKCGIEFNNFCDFFKFFKRPQSDQHKFLTHFSYYKKLYEERKNPTTADKSLKNTA